jgi:hypothetical protein
VRVDLDDIADDGEVGEGDNVGSNVEVVVGGAGDDVLAGSDGSNILYGRAGDDVLHGKQGGDHLYGAAGDDRIWGGRGRDFLNGGGGADSLFARDRRPDTLRGGGDRDRARVDRRLDDVRGVEHVFLPPPPPTTLVRTRAPIDGIAADGARIAWAGAFRSARCPHVRLFRVVTRRHVLIGPEDGHPSCSEVTLERLYEFVIALGGERAVWGGFSPSGNNAEGTVLTGTPRERVAYLTDLFELSKELHLYGDFITGAAGDGRTLVYATVHVDVVDAACFQLPHQPPCRYEVTHGAVQRVVGRTRSPLAGAPASMGLAVAGNRVALIPADLSETTTPEPHSVAGGPVEIRNATSGQLVASFSPAGTVEAVALTARAAAVLVSDASGKRIERYDAVTGDFIASTPVDRAAAPEIDMAGRWIVYRSRRTIHVLDASAGRDSVVAGTRSWPFDVSIEGRRVIWAENRTSNWPGAIRSVVVG